MIGGTNVACTTSYLGCRIEVCDKDFLIFTPDGDIACFSSMRRARLWIRRHRRMLRGQA